MSESTKPDALLTRRRLLQTIGAAGGAAATYETMVALGLLAQPTAWAGRLPIRPDQGRGKSVVILGAGMGGLTAAYELTRAGFDVTVLEASPRAGGR